jgi:hypothetical protein
MLCQPLAHFKALAWDDHGNTINPMQARYTRFSEEWNAFDYLEKTTEFIRRADQNPTDWKWVILCLHGALYGFMICALKGTDPDRVVHRDKKNRPHLISFSTALEWCQDPVRMTMTTESKVLQLSECQKEVSRCFAVPLSQFIRTLSAVSVVNRTSWHARYRHRWPTGYTISEP